jgi:hypothetical protein
VNARDLLDRADGIIFEGDAVRSWVEQLAKRARGAIEAAQKNRYFEEEWQGEYKELEQIVMALQRAQEQLTLFESAVRRREAE